VAEPTTGPRVVFSLTPAWYAVLVGELDAVSHISAFGAHHPGNAEALWQMLMNQGGANVAPRDKGILTEPISQSTTPPKKERQRIFSGW